MDIIAPDYQMGREESWPNPQNESENFDDASANARNGMTNNNHDSWLGSAYVSPANAFSSTDTGRFPEIDDEESYLTTGSAYLSPGETYGIDLRPGELMSPKVPPAWDGRGSWFTYEELVYDWVDCTTLDISKRGPALRNRLVGEATIWRRTLDREALKAEDGVEYFLRCLRPHFVKGNQAVFLLSLIHI